MFQTVKTRVKNYLKVSFFLLTTYKICFYSSEKEYPWVPLHFPTRLTMPSNAFSIILLFRFLHACIIYSCHWFRFCGSRLRGTFQIVLLRYTNRKKSHIAKSGERAGHGQSPLLLITWPGNCMSWSTILLPPHMRFLLMLRLGNSRCNI